MQWLLRFKYSSESWFKWNINFVTRIKLYFMEILYVLNENLFFMMWNICVGEFDGVFKNANTKLSESS